MLAELAAAVVSSAPGEDITTWLQNLGSFSLAAAVGYAAFRREANRADRAEARADAERARADTLADRMVDDVIPAVERVTAVQGQFIEAARELRWAAQYGGRTPPSG